MTLLRPGKGGIEGGPTVVANLLWPLLPTPNRLGFSRPFAHGAWLRGREARWLMAWDDHPLEKKKKTDFKHALGRDFLLVCREVVCCFDVYVYILYSFNISKRFFFFKSTHPVKVIMIFVKWTNGPPGFSETARSEREDSSFWPPMIGIIESYWKGLITKQSTNREGCIAKQTIRS